MMKEQLNECPVCGKTELRSYTKIKDHKVSRETFNLDQCVSCGFLFTNPRPDESEIGKYYESENYVSHTDTKKGVINFLYHQVRKITLKNKLNWINKYTRKKGIILDVGCGTGYFLSTCKKGGWEISGVEPDPGARKIATENTGSKIVASLNEVEKKKYDAITLWHVLEHVHHLNETVITIRELIDDNGTIFIALPNYQSYDAKLYNQYWDGFEVPRHLYHFSRNSIQKLLDKHNLKITDTLPMKFDAYYVSLLSEGYKHNGKINMPRAFLNGLKSNLKAKKEMNYSAILYVVRKK